MFISLVLEYLVTSKILINDIYKRDHEKPPIKILYPKTLIKH